MFQKFLDGFAHELGKNAEVSNRVFQLRESQGMMEALRDLGKGTVALCANGRAARWRQISGRAVAQCRVHAGESDAAER